MKYIRKKFLAILIAVLLFVTLFPSAVFALGSAGISLSSSSVTLGNSFTATLSFGGGGGYIAGVSAYISYNSSLIQFVSASGDGQANISAGKGNIVLETTSTSKSSLSIKLNFKTIAEGSATISITGSDVVDWNGATVGNATASKSVTIKAATVKPSQSAEPVETETPPKNPEIEEAVPTEIEGVTLYLWRDLSNVTLPDGFVAGNYTYKGEAIQAATSEKKGLMLFYLTDEEGLNGRFYIYDEKAGTLSSFLIMTFSADEYTVLTPGEGVAIPRGYTITTLMINGVELAAWKTKEGAAFYLIYAINKDGIVGFYSYDTYEKTLQRFNQEIVVNEEPLETSEPVDADPDQNREERSVFERLLDDEQILSITSVFAGIIVISTLR